MNNLPAEDFVQESSEGGANNEGYNNNLPIFQCKDEIIKAVENNQFVVIHGETGCGKTTQVPQFLFKAGLHKNRVIGITQPRRIAAVSMAKRVACEMKEQLGKNVGYEVRFDKKCGASTKIKYMTDGILMNECVIDKQLMDYQIVMIDEAHERSVISDVLLGLLKKIAVKRKDLKVIISSATISVDKFVTYFDNAEVILIKSGMFHVDVLYHSFTCDYMKKITEIVQQIHLQEQRCQEQNNSNKGDILVFLTGQEEIYMCCEELTLIENVVPKPLCGSIDFDSQKEVFDPVKPYETKVVVATNIAETSITIDTIKYVIDCGYVKQKNYNHERSMDVLEDVRVSKAQADQRKGRAGRTQEGVCHRLYARSKFDSLEKEAIPEIYRKNLSEIYLKLITLDLNPKDFDFLDPPNISELERSEKKLVDLSLLRSDGKLTAVGTQVSSLPLDPILGKVIITSLSHHCTTDVIRIVAMFSEKMEKIFNRPRNKAKIADQKRCKFNDPGGDHFTLLKVYNEWSEQRNKRKWCYDNFISGYTMENVEKIIKQLHWILERNKIKIENKGENNSRNEIQHCFVAGYFRNICIRQPRDVYSRVFDKEVFYIHGSSCLKNSGPKIILFHDPIKSSRSFASGVLQLDENILRKDFKKELKGIHFPEDIDLPSTF